MYFYQDPDGIIIKVEMPCSSSLSQRVCVRVIVYFWFRSQEYRHIIIVCESGEEPAVTSELTCLYVNIGIWECGVVLENSTGNTYFFISYCG